MSVVANYVRVSEEQLRAWRSDPDMMGAIVEGRVPGAEHCDVDVAYQAIAWLLSPGKREEQRRLAAAWPKIRSLASQGSAASTESAGNQPIVDYSGLEPDDLLLTALEGRALEQEREAQIDYGLGASCVFTAAMVQEIDQAMKAVTREQFGQHFSPAVMAEQMVEPEIWDEGEGLLDEFLRPAFERLRGFFTRAAAAKQSVVVVYA